MFFTEQPGGSIAASIVDPHGQHLGDALPKLRGLANYAERHGHHYQRIDAVAKVGDTVMDAVAQVKGKIVVGPPKSVAGRRTVAVPASVLPVLREHVGSFSEAGARGHLFVGARGHTLRRTNFQPERMGHSSTRAAIIYLHAAKDGDRSIAAGIDRRLSGGMDGDGQEEAAQS